MSVLTDIIVLLYSYQQADIDTLARKLTERRRASYINAISDLARKHGCDKLGTTPKGEDARYLSNLSKQDAKSIANTFNRDVRAQVERLFKANPKGNRSYYTSNLEKWSNKRDTWKVYTIALNTDGTARQYAFTRFYQNNPQIGRRFVASGVPAVCKICLRIFAAGIVDLSYVQTHPLPAHIGCPHLYRPLAPARAECGKLWLG